MRGAQWRERVAGGLRRCHDLSQISNFQTMKTTSSQAALSAVALATAAATVSIYILKKRRKKTTYIIAGDIGGTNSRFALYRQGEREPLLVHVYPNETALATTKSYHHATLKPFLEKCVAEVEEWSCMVDDIRNKVQVVVCLATAGPVNTTKNNVYMTNMGKGGQFIDGNAIEECQDGLLSIVVRCKLVNDFVGQGENIFDSLDIIDIIFHCAVNSSFFICLFLYFCRIW